MKRNNQFDQRKRDIEVRDALRRQLKKKPALRRVKCDFVDGCAILWGDVETDSDFRLAEKVVLERNEVEAIDNRIQIESVGAMAG